MVNFQIFVCFNLIFGLVPTIALQDDTEVKKTCTFEAKSFRTAREIKDKTEDLNSCQDVCDAEENCLIWRDDGRICNLTVYTLKDDSDVISSGINNCQNVSDNAISCEAKKKDAKLKKTRVKPDQKACKTLCEESMDCILWEFSKKNKCTLFNLIEKEVPSNAIDTFGVRFCSPSTTTTTTATTTTTTTVILPDNPECSVYTTLEDTSRSILYGNGTYDSVKDNLYCDILEHYSSGKSPGWVGESWYQMPDGARIPEESPGIYRCGTWIPGYLKGTHPTTPGESLDNAKFCFDWEKDDCDEFTMGSITNCGNFMVYKLKDAPWCEARYCYTEEF